MSAQTVIKEATDCGVQVSLNGDSLALKAAVEPPAALLAKLRDHKAEIVTLLRRPRSQTSGPDQAEIDERKSLAAGGVPDAYLDAWARLQVERPVAVSEAEWRRAIDDAGLFLDRWGGLAVEFQWLRGDLFDAPRDGSQRGLVWFLKGEAVRAIGDGHAVTTSGRVFDRLTHGEWINPY